LGELYICPLYFNPFPVKSCKLPDFLSKSNAFEGYGDFFLPKSLLIYPLSFRSRIPLHFELRSLRGLLLLFCFRVIEFLRKFLLLDRLLSFILLEDLLMTVERCRAAQFVRPLRFLFIALSNMLFVRLLKCKHRFLLFHLFRLPFSLLLWPFVFILLYFLLIINTIFSINIIHRKHQSVSRILKRFFLAPTLLNVIKLRIFCKRILLFNSIEIILIVFVVVDY
jgi:hypothetical protein